METGKKQPPVAPRGPRLSRDRILAAAVGLVAREGVEGLSMRRLAQDLDVWPMAVYRYFHDKDELLAAMIGAAADSVPLPEGTGPWRAQMSELLRGARLALRPHSSSLGLRGGQPLVTPGGLRMSEAALRLLERAGFCPPEAMRAWRALFGYTIGFAALTGGDARDDAAHEARAAIAMGGETDYPALTTATKQLDAADDEAQFDYGLNLLLDGLEASLESRPAATAEASAAPRQA